VATGHWAVHDLAAHGAEIVLRDFTDMEQSLKLLLGPTH
jgi:hypothetical protein